MRPYFTRAVFGTIVVVAFGHDVRAEDVAATTLEHLDADPLPPAIGQTWFRPGVLLPGRLSPPGAFRLSPDGASIFTLRADGAYGFVDWATTEDRPVLHFGYSSYSNSFGGFGVPFTNLVGKFVAVRCYTTAEGDPSPGGCDFNLDDKRLARLTHDAPGVGAGRYIFEIGDGGANEYARTRARWLGDFNWSGDDGDHRIQVDQSPSGVPGRSWRLTAGQGADGQRGGDVYIDGGAAGSGSTGGAVIVGGDAQTATVAIGHAGITTQLLGVPTAPSGSALTVAPGGVLALGGTVSGHVIPTTPASVHVGVPGSPVWDVYADASAGLVVVRSTDSLRLFYGGVAGLGAGYNVRSTGPPLILSSPSYFVLSGSIVRLIPSVGGFSDLAAVDGTSIVRVTDDGKLGFYGAAPVARPSAAGQPIEESSTGGIGSTSYTLGDIVRAAKLVGLVAP